VSSRSFTAATFAFLHQVNEDNALVPSDLKTALALTKHFNEKDGGRAYPSCATLAAEAGVSEKTVISAVRRMEQHGHLRVAWGKQGRGHPNQYWMNVKPALTQVLESGKPASRAPQKPASIGEREEDRCRDLSPVPAAAPDGAAGMLVQEATRLLAIYRRGWPADDDPKTVAAVCAEFNKLIADRVPAGSILGGAQTWVAAFADEPRFLPPLVTFLTTRAFAQPPPPKKRRRRTTRSTATEPALAMLQEGSSDE
jgi:hypothetical protein